MTFSTKGPLILQESQRLNELYAEAARAAVAAAGNQTSGSKFDLAFTRQLTELPKDDSATDKVQDILGGPSQALPPGWRMRGGPAEPEIVLRGGSRGVDPETVTRGARPTLEPEIVMRGGPAEPASQSTKATDIVAASRPATDAANRHFATAERYSGMAQNAENAMRAGRSEQATVAAVVGQSAGRVALDTDRRAVFEAGERIAAANRAIEEANTDPSTGGKVPANRRIGNGGAGMQAMQQIKQTRDEYAGHTQPGNRGSIQPGATDVETQGRLADAAKKAAEEIPNRIKTLKERIAETSGPNALSKLQRQQLTIAVQELEAAQAALNPLARNGPTKANELTAGNLRRATEMQVIEAGNEAKVALRSESLDRGERTRMNSMASKRDMLAHNDHAQALGGRGGRRTNALGALQVISGAVGFLANKQEAEEQLRMAMALNEVPRLSQDAVSEYGNIVASSAALHGLTLGISDGGYGFSEFIKWGQKHKIPVDAMMRLNPTGATPDEISTALTGGIVAHNDRPQTVAREHVASVSGGQHVEQDPMTLRPTQVAHAPQAGASLHRS